jgi:hypothetical protein
MCTGSQSPACFSRSMYGSPDGASQFQYPGMARSLGVILRRAALFFLTRPDSSNLWQVQCAGDHAAQEYQRQNRGCGMVNIHDAMQAAQHRARQKTVSVPNAPRPRKQTPRRSSQLYLTRPDRPLQQRSIADRNRAKPPPERGEHAAANDVAAVVVVVGSTVHVVVVRISVIIRGVIRRIEPVA